MDDTDRMLMNEAAAEITRLRKDLNEKSLRLGMFDDLMTVLHSRPFSPTQGYAEDIVFKMRKRIEAQNEKGT